MILLREITQKNLEYVRTLRNKNKEYFFHDQEITVEQQNEWYRNYLKEDPKSYFFFVVHKNAKTPIGTISIHSKTEGNELGNIIIDEPYRGQGWLERIVRDIKMSFAKLYLEVKPDNTRAIKAYKKCGFEIRSLTMQL